MKYKFNDLEIETVVQLKEDTKMFVSKDKYITFKEMMDDKPYVDVMGRTTDGKGYFAQIAFPNDYMVTLKNGLSFVFPKAVFEELVKEVE